MINALQPGLSKEFAAKKVRNLAGHTIGDGAIYRELSRGLCGAALYDDRVGQDFHAVNTRLDVLEFGVMVSHGGRVVDDLVSNAIVSIGYIDLEPSVAKLAGLQLENSARRLERIRSKLGNFEPIMLEDGNVDLYYFIDSINHSRSIRHRFDTYRNVDWGLTAARKVTPTELWGFAKKEMVDKTQLTHELQVYYRKAAGEMSGVFKKSLNTQVPIGAPDWIVLDLSMHAWAQHLITQSRIDLLRLEVAILRFKSANNKYPASLAELSPKYLKILPVDLFDNNKSYKYRIKSDGACLLYGLGDDMVNHHGTPGKYAGDKGFDLVAGHLAGKIKLPKK